MLYREIIAVCSEIHTKYKYTVWAEHGFLNVKLGGMYSDHWGFYYLFPHSIYMCI